MIIAIVAIVFFVLGAGLGSASVTRRVKSGIIEIDGKIYMFRDFDERNNLNFNAGERY